MRPISAPARLIQKGRNVNYHSRLKVANGDGVLIDISYFLDTWSIEVQADAKVATANFALHRETSEFSLAPLMGGSSLNRKADDSYSPLLYGGRAFTFETATVAAGAVPLSTDWVEVIGGKIDKVNWQSDPVTIEGRDRGAYLQRTWIKEPKIYNFDETTHEVTKVDIQDQLTTLLTDNMSSPPALTVLGDPDAQVGAYTQEEMNLMDALEAIAQKRAWDIRYKYGSDGVSRLTFYEVDRDTTTEDDSIGPSEYYEVNDMSVSDVDVRNVIRVYYIDENDGETKFVQYPAEEDVDTDPSVIEFGQQFMKIGTEATKELIFDATAAMRLAVAAYKELSTPFAGHEIICSYLWQAEIGDLYKFLANNVHYDSDQKYFVTGVRHEGSLGHAETTLTTRGKPLSYKKKWFRLANKGEIEGVPEVLFVNDAIPIYGPDGLQKGWEIKGAVDSETKSVQVKLTGALSIETTIPEGVEYTSSPVDYRIDTTIEKQFNIQFLQAAGGEGEFELIPRAQFSTTGGGGIAGPMYKQKLARSPQTILTVLETGIITTRQLSFSVLPVSSTLHYRLKVGSGAFEDWKDVALDANGKFADEIIEVNYDVVVEYYSTSSNGVAENKQRLTIDQDNLPEFTVDGFEDPPNYIYIIINPDDDVVSWKVWAREKGAENPNFVAPTYPAWPYNIYGNATTDGRPEPDDQYLRFDGTVNTRSIRMYAENGAWWIIIRVYDKYGNFQEGGFLMLIGGGASGPMISNLYTQLVKPWPSGNVAKVGVVFEHNQAAADAGTTKVVVKENGVIVSESDRPVTKDFDDTDPGQALRGGWSREIVIADPNSPDAEFIELSYVVEHRDIATDGQLQYGLSAAIKLWVQRTGDPGTETDPPTDLPAAPIAHNSGPAFSAWAQWGGVSPPAGLDSVIEWEQSFNGGIDFDPVEIGGTIVPAGTYTMRKTGLSSLTVVRCRVAYKTGAGLGPWSDWSNVVQVAGTGTNNEDF
jgi:hypothetical protein